MPKPEKMKAAYAYDLTDNAVITINGKDISGSALNDNDEYTAYDLQGSRITYILPVQTLV